MSASRISAFVFQDRHRILLMKSLSHGLVILSVAKDLILPLPLPIRIEVSQGFWEERDFIPQVAGDR
jgi:hypothetical protein